MLPNGQKPNVKEILAPRLSSGKKKVIWLNFTDIMNKAFQISPRAVTASNGPTFKKSWFEQNLKKHETRPR